MSGMDFKLQTALWGLLVVLVVLVPAALSCVTAAVIA